MSLRFSLYHTLLFFAVALLGAAPALAVPASSSPVFALQVQERDTTDKEDSLPLEPARTIAIDQTEGTWISVDVSPDGETIVFDYLGDLFTMPVGGGQAAPLTSGMAFDAQPRFSPDGERVVFTSDRSGGQNIWIMSLDDRELVQVSKGKANRAESPEWTPDGNYIVASMGAARSGDLPKLHLYHVEGGKGAKLVSDQNGNGLKRTKMLGAAFGNEASRVWYAQRKGDWEYNAQLPQYQLYVYDRETGERSRETSRYGSAFRPTLSPDGRYLVYGTRHDQETGLVLRDLRTSEERWLAYPVQHDDQESRATLDVLPGMAFTPDSEHLVASYGGKIWKVPVAGGDAEEIPFRVTLDLDVGPEVFFDYEVDDSPTFTVRQIRDAKPSPDGARLAFTALDRLYLADADGSDPRPLTDAEASAHFPAWSPDGRWIAYATWEGDEGHLWKVRADGGGEPQRLTTEGGLYLTPAWSPDGERIVAIRGTARDYRESASASAARSADELVWVSTGGGDVNLIAPSEGRRAPHFTKESDRIYLFHGKRGLISIRWDGTDERAHLKVRGGKPAGFSDPLDPEVILMAPEGDQALASINRQLYVVTVPQIGREAPTISVANPKKASFPARRLTDPTGSEFPAWGADGRTVHWSLGNAHFVYDLDAAEAFADSLEAVRGADEDTSEEADTSEVDEDGSEEADTSTPDEETYEPREFRVTVTATRDIPSGVAVLRGGRAVTMRGDEIIEDADILVRDNRIAAVGSRGTVDVPADARVIDVSGTTIVPGFIDAHAHLRSTRNVHRRDQWVYGANLAYGVTATRDPQTGTTDVLTYSDLVRTGDIVGPRVYSTGPGVFWQEMISSQDEARDVLSRYSDYFDTKTIKMYVSGNRQQRQWIIMAARELGLMPTTEGSLNLKQNINETIDGYPGLEHSLPVYPVYDDVVQLFAETRRAYTPTLLVAYGGPFGQNFFFTTEEPHEDPKLRRFFPHEELDRLTLRRGNWFSAEEHVFQEHARFVRDLIEAGGLAAVGSHGQLQGLGYHWELWAMASGGLSNHDALRAATLFGAEAIGLKQELGSIEPGKLADLVVLQENPLEEIRHSNTLRYVMRNGRLYDAETLAEVWPRQRELEPAAWQAEEPSPTLPGVGESGRGD